MKTKPVKTALPGLAFGLALALSMPQAEAQSSWDKLKEKQDAQGIGNHGGSMDQKQNKTMARIAVQNGEQILRTFKRVRILEAKVNALIRTLPESKQVLIRDQVAPLKEGLDELIPEQKQE